MGLLDDILAQQGSGGPFNGAFPSNLFGEADAAQAAREAAALRLARGVRRTPEATASPFDGGVAPLSFAGSGAFGIDPSSYATPAEPQSPSISGPIPLPRPRPAEADAAPTDVSAASRAIGAPLSLAPPVPSQPAQAPAPTSAAPPEKGFLENLRGKVNDNSNMLLAFAGGLAGGRSWGDGLSKGLQMAVPAGQLDTAARQKQITQTATYSALKARGVSDADAMLAMQNPEALKSLLSRLWPTFKSANVGNTTGSFNEATGEFKPGFTDTKYEKIGQGDTLYATPGGVPGAGGVSGKPVAVASGGPQQPPAGYQYVDTNDPAKGLQAIPGGPGTHLPSETAGRIAMMETAAAALPDARRVLMEGRGSSGTGVTGAAASALNIGETGRANRTVTVAIEGALRAMTGAAAPESEVKRYENMFMPSPLDSRETATQKLNQLQDFIDNAKRLVTQGRGPAGGPPGPRASDPLGIR